MSDAFINVSEDKILDLYNAGYSQKDIAEMCKTTPVNVRTVLKAKGYDTFRFRALDEDVTDMIILLITNGIRFKDIENICHISCHATRDVVARHNLQRASKRARYNNMEPVLPDGYVQNPELLEWYLAGESFCSLCKDLSLSNEEILFEFMSMTTDQIEAHTAKLKEKVLSDAEHQFSPTAIARKHTISMSVVRSILAGKR